MESLQAGKRILVTGASLGIGLGLIEALAKHAHPFVIILTEPTRLACEKSVEFIIEKYPAVKKRLHGLILDISRIESITDIPRQVARICGKLDILVNNIEFLPEIGKYSKEASKMTLRANYFGTAALSEAMLTTMEDKSKIINISSILGKLHLIPNRELRTRFDDQRISRAELLALADEYLKDVSADNIKKKWPENPYVISKILVNIYTRVLSKEPSLVERQIQVYACCPSWIPKGSSSASFENGIVCPMYLIELPFEFDKAYQGQFFQNQMVARI